MKSLKITMLVLSMLAAHNLGAADIGGKVITVENLGEGDITVTVPYSDTPLGMFAIIKGGDSATIPLYKDFSMKKGARAESATIIANGKEIDKIDFTQKTDEEIANNKIVVE